MATGRQVVLASARAALSGRAESQMGNECEGEAELELEFLLSGRSTWGTKLQHSTVPKYSMYSSLQVTVPDRKVHTGGGRRQDCASHPWPCGCLWKETGIMRYLLEPLMGFYCRSARACVMPRYLKVGTRTCVGLFYFCASRHLALALSSRRVPKRKRSSGVGSAGGVEQRASCQPDQPDNQIRPQLPKTC